MSKNLLPYFGIDIENYEPKYPKIEALAEWVKYLTYYDGPCAGIVDISGCQYFAVMCDENGLENWRDDSKPTWVRRFVAVELPDGVFPIADTEQNPPLNYSQNPVIGWFED